MTKSRGIRIRSGTIDTDDDRRFPLEDTERGATTVEASIMLALLLVVLFGILEFGLAGKNWLTVSHASREAARAAATFGDETTAQIETLDNIEQEMAVVGLADAGLQVRIFDPATGVSDTYSYYPGSTFCRAPGDCCTWSPCPDPFYVAANGLSGYVSPNYAPSSRDVTAPNTGRVGVEVAYAHSWVTNMLNLPDVDMTVAVDYSLEPRAYDS